MTKTNQLERSSSSSRIRSMPLYKNFRIFLLLIFVGFFLWYFLRSGSYNTLSDTGLPIFANAAAAEAHASQPEAEAPDYAQYADLKVPPLPPEKALETFDLEEGFRIELVAHEPDIIDPVAMDIDPDGRLWVVEMPSYMPVYDKEEEETSELERLPESRIVVLEDTTGDGRMDHSWVFMNNLVLPRAIKVLDDGVLIAEPPNVWFIQDTTGDGIGDIQEKIYSPYGDTASYNVEHMANGLMWGMDNWIHSVYSNVSLRRVDGQWKTRPFERLTQWGMTQDNWGRVYSAHNTRTLTTHLIPYSYSHRHPDFSLQEGIYVNIAESEAMWPAHPTGVNRGYRVNQVVDENGMLIRSTATCGPVIYRGDQFGEEYVGNAFVPEPAGNLIKRLVDINEKPGAIEAKARFAYRGREFLTSTDERFRPVNMYNAPDGSIYVIDMYRGIFQHARYLTDHLREYAVERGLHQPTGMGQFGRIYRIVREDHAIDYNTPKLRNKEPDELVHYLTHKNGMLRDAAQQLLVQRSPTEVIPTLEDFVSDTSLKFYIRLQALWTLEGFDRDRYKQTRLSSVAQSALEDAHPRVRAAAIRILEPEIRQNSEDMLRILDRMAREESTSYTQLQLLASLGESNNPQVLKTMAYLLDKNSESPYFREMALTGVYRQEAELLAILQTDYNWLEGEDNDKDRIITHLVEAAAEPSGPELQLSGEERHLFKLGEQHFQNCLACHGDRGQGIEGVAPPLAGSKWVEGDPEMLVRIVLQGYESGNGRSTNHVAGVMPAHKFMSDKEIAAILTYIRQSWGNSASPVSVDEVATIRKASEDRSEEWTPVELRKLQD